MTTRRRHRYQPDEDGRVNVTGRQHIYQLDDDGWVNVTGRRHIYQPDEESRDGPSKRGAFQDDWQSDEDISALEGMAIDDDGRLEKA